MTIATQTGLSANLPAIRAAKRLRVTGKFIKRHDKPKIIPPDIVSSVRFNERHERGEIYLPPSPLSHSLRAFSALHTDPPSRA